MCASPSSNPKPRGKSSPKTSLSAHSRHHMHACMPCTVTSLIFRNGQILKCTLQCHYLYSMHCRYQTLEVPFCICHALQRSLTFMSAQRLKCTRYSLSVIPPLPTSSMSASENRQEQSNTESIHVQYS